MNLWFHSLLDGEKGEKEVSKVLGQGVLSPSSLLEVVGYLGPLQDYVSYVLEEEDQQTYTVVPADDQSLRTVREC